MNNAGTQLPTDYQNFIALSRYARWIPEENRREEWSETVDRYLNYMRNHLIKKHNFDEKVYYELEDRLFHHITNLNIMPSMRALMTSGKALDKCHLMNACIYLCVVQVLAFLLREKT